MKGPRKTSERGFRLTRYALVDDVGATWDFDHSVGHNQDPSALLSTTDAKRVIVHRYREFEEISFTAAAILTREKPDGYYAGIYRRGPDSILILDLVH